MKTKIIITIIIAVFIAAILSLAYILYPRSKPAPVKIEVKLLDMTDTFRLKPEPADIEQGFSVSKRKQGRIARIKTVVDVEQGDLYLFELEPYQIPGQPETWNLSSNDIFRDEKIEAFEKGVWDTINRLYDDSIGYNQTALLAPMVEELIYLQDYNNDDRSLAVYSDLVENRNELSFLDNKTIALLQKDRLSVWESVSGVETLNDLSGIVVYFIHRPMSGEEADRYRIISNYLKRRLESYGAKVIIQGKVIHQSK